MRQFLTVVAFALLTIGFFAGYSNYGIPQIEPAPPPSEEKLDLGSMTMESFIAVGDRIFNGKGHLHALPQRPWPRAGSGCDRRSCAEAS